MRAKVPPCGLVISIFVNPTGIRLPRLVRRCALAAALFALIGLASGVASANSISDFGLTYTSLGNATLSLAMDGGVQVSNIGSGGQDGVSVAMPADIASPTGTVAFSLDTSNNFSALPVGGYFQTTTYGPIGNDGTAPILSTMTETQDSDSILFTSDFSNSSNGPVTTNYYSDAKLIYTELESGLTSGQRMHGPILTPSSYTDGGWNSDGQGGGTGGWDPPGGFGVDIITVDGTDLPASDDIDLIDSSAPDNFAAGTSSISYTTSGISSFEITGEALSVPEPATGALFILTLTCSAMRRRRTSI